MMKRSAIALLPIAWLAFTGCTKETLQPLTRLPLETVLENLPTATVDLDFYTRDVNRKVDNMKCVFIFDKSGSNVQTDPLGIRRYQSLKAFLESPESPTNETTYYKMIEFSLGARRVPANTGFTNDKPGFIALIQQLWNNLVDVGPTDMLSAFDETKALIEEDLEIAKADPVKRSSHYVIYHVSDGAPYVDGELQPIEAIEGSVTNILALALDATNAPYISSIRVNSVYYHNDPGDPIAEQTMRRVAIVGKGQFRDVSNGQAINFFDLSVPVQRQEHHLRETLVANVSTVWSEEGALKLDSDNDNLSDESEMALGSSPYLADSDNNGFDDFLEGQLFGSPCGASDCAAASARLFNGCQLYRKPGTGSRVEFIDTDNDELNDCAEIKYLHSRHDNFDENGDFVPDGLAFKRGLAFLTGQNDSQADRDNDGIRNYFELKWHEPVFFPNDLLPRRSPYLYNLTRLGNDDLRVHYNLNVRDIRVLGPDNRIRIYEIESTSIISSKRYLRRAEKSLGERSLLSFVNGDLK